MCRPTAAPAQDDTGAVLERLQARLAQQMQLGGPQALNLCGADHLAHVASRGTGPRLFCGHVPPVSAPGEGREGGRREGARRATRMVYGREA